MLQSSLDSHFELFIDYCLTERMNFDQDHENVSSESDDDIPLASIRGIRDLIEFARRKKAADKAGRLLISRNERSSTPLQNAGSTSSTPRKASEKAMHSLHRLCREEIDALDDSDADPDFVLPAKRKQSSGDEEVMYFPLLDFDAAGDHVKAPSDPQTHKEADRSTIVQKRKRKTHAERNQERAEARKRKIEENYAVKPGCTATCPRKTKCSDRFSEEDRVKIQKLYWSLDYSARKSYIIERVSRCPVKRRRSAEKTSLKQASFKYTLKSCSDGSVHEVCKKFFLATLGFSAKNDTIIFKTFKSLEEASNAGETETRNPCEDRRGNHKAMSDVDASVKEFIERFHPTVSHYNREKTPQRRYLPSDISISNMYKEYCLNHPKISFSKFYNTFKTMKISLCSLGNEECQECERFKFHKMACDCVEVCDVSEYMKHKIKYRAARAEYQKDVLANRSGSEHMRVSADLQKIILLRRMNQFKECVFTPRLVVFNETISELGKNGKDTAVVWHEAISGRKDEDIASAFFTFIQSVRDVKKLTMWLDNCSGQNKNWTFFTMLLSIVNSPEFEVEEIQLKFFEPGHSFMASDAEHGRIETNMRKRRTLYDFRDFVSTVKEANCETLEMRYNDFRKWTSGVSQYALKQLGDRRPYMNQIVSANFLSGSEEMRYQTAFSAREIGVRFLKKDFDLMSHQNGIQTTKPRGLEPKKKAAIVDKLTPLMPENRRPFWTDLPVDKRSEDLAN